jgi:hypothetical protein
VKWGLGHTRASALVSKWGGKVGAQGGWCNNPNGGSLGARGPPMRTWRWRSAMTAGLSVGPSTPQFQEKLSLVPSPGTGGNNVRAEAW